MIQRFVLLALVLSSVGCFDSERPALVEGVCEQSSMGPIDWDEGAAVFGLFEESVEKVRNLNLEPDEDLTIGVLKPETLASVDAESVISDLISAGLFWTDRSAQRCLLPPVVQDEQTLMQVDASFEVCSNYCWFETRSVVIKIDQSSGLVQLVGSEPVAFE